MGMGFPTTGERLFLGVWAPLRATTPTGTECPMLPNGPSAPIQGRHEPGRHRRSSTQIPEEPLRWTCWIRCGNTGHRNLGGLPDVDSRRWPLPNFPKPLPAAGPPRLRWTPRPTSSAAGGDHKPRENWRIWKDSGPNSLSPRHGGGQSLSEGPQLGDSGPDDRTDPVASEDPLDAASLLKRQSTHGRAGCGNLASPIRRGRPKTKIAEPGPSTRWSLRVAGGCAAFPVHEPVITHHLILGGTFSTSQTSHSHKEQWQQRRDEVRSNSSMLHTPVPLVACQPIRPVNGEQHNPASSQHTEHPAEPTPPAASRKRQPDRATPVTSTRRV